MRLRCLLAASLALATAAPAQRAAIPTPAAAFGFAPGADGRWFGYDESVAYFRRLAAASGGRMRLLDVGRTSFGKPWTLAVISSPANLARLERLRTINQRLAHPDGLADAEARRLAREARAFVDISGGLHASEIAGSQHTPQLAYELLSRADSADVRRVLDETVLFLWPSINPDGQDIVVDWCRARAAGKNPPPMELYQKYVGHDNNRDGYMLNVVESRVVQRTWRYWEPDLIYVHHQSAPFPTRIWVPPFADPVGLRVPPLMAREVNTVGMWIAQELDAQGKPGATHQGTGYDAWYPGYIDYLPMYQNVPAFWTETQGGNCGLPRTSPPDSFPAEYRALAPTSMYASPWTGGRWANADAVAYMVAASRAALTWAATHRETLLYDRYLAGTRTIAKYRAAAPYAYVIPQRQRDPMAPVELLRRLAFLGVRVTQAARDVTYDGATYPAGTWVIPMDQEFAELARELLEVQRYPDMGDDLPYDAAGWTLPFQMQVTVVEGTTPLAADVRAALRPVQGTAVDWRSAPDAPLTTSAAAAGIVPPPAELTGAGAGDALAVSPVENAAFRLVGRALAAGGRVRFAPGTPERAARYLVTGVDTARLGGWARELALHAAWTADTAAARLLPARIALYEAAPGNMDEGWTEWLLDTHGVPYTRVGPADLRAGALAERFDAIVVASQRLAAGDSVTAAVDAFVRAGGTVVAWNQGATAAVSALGLPVRNVLAGVPRAEHFTGGSILRVAVDTLHPVMAGMPAAADVFVYNSPAFAPGDGFAGQVLARYAAEGSPLRSGFLRGERFLQGSAAALDVERDRGHVVLFAFQPQWRGQPTGTFRVVFNALLAAGGAARPNDR